MHVLWLSIVICIVYISYELGNEFHASSGCRRRACQISDLRCRTWAELYALLAVAAKRVKELNIFPIGDRGP